MIRLEILSGKQAGQTILVRRFPFQIGRSPQAGLPLLEPGVWDEHCRIEYRPAQGFFLCATPSAETRVNSLPVEQTLRLPNASEIALGAVRLRFSVADPPPRDLRLREAVAWLFLAAVVVGEACLIYWLPR